MPGTNTPKSKKQRQWPAISATYPMVSSRTVGDYVIETHSKPVLKTNSRRSHGHSSMLPSQLQSKLLMTGSLILTIKYTCPACSGVHFLDFPSFSSMNGKTSRRLMMRCSTNYACKVGWLRWETDGRAFTISGALKPREWTK